MEQVDEWVSTIPRRWVDEIWNFKNDNEVLGEECLIVVSMLISIKKSEEVPL